MGWRSTKIWISSPANLTSRLTLRWRRSQQKIKNVFSKDLIDKEEKEEEDDEDKEPEEEEDEEEDEDDDEAHKKENEDGEDNQEEKMK